MFHNLFTTNSHFVHIYFLYYFHKNKLHLQMINSKIAHRFFIIAPVVIQSGSPHFIRRFQAAMRLKAPGLSLYCIQDTSRHFSISDRISFFNYNLKGTSPPPPWRKPSLSSLCGPLKLICFQSPYLIKAHISSKPISHQSSYTWSQVKSGSEELLSAFFVFFPPSSV